MYKSFFGFSKKPFSLTPDPEFLFLSSNHKKALTMLQYGLMSQAGFTVITGEIGAGKTTLIRYVLNTIEYDSEVGLITNTHSAFGDLLTWILAAFNIEHQSRDKAERYKTFIDFVTTQHERGRNVILIVDEAQNMDLLTLEELRLLSNINVSQNVMLQLILVGQPELVNKLNKPELVQFAQRISAEYHLLPLGFEETEQYIHYRLAVAGLDAASSLSLFKRTACATVFYYTGGVPRLINNICDLALVFAFADEKKEIDWRTIQDVIREKKTGGIIPIDGNRCPEAEKIRQSIINEFGIDIALNADMQLKAD